MTIEMRILKGVTCVVGGVASIGIACKAPESLPILKYGSMGITAYFTKEVISNFYRVIRPPLPERDLIKNNRDKTYL